MYKSFPTAATACNATAVQDEACVKAVAPHPHDPPTLREATIPREHRQRSRLTIIAARLVASFARDTRRSGDDERRVHTFGGLSPTMSVDVRRPPVCSVVDTPLTVPLMYLQKREEGEREKSESAILRVSCVKFDLSNVTQIRLFNELLLFRDFLLCTCNGHDRPFAFFASAIFSSAF